MDTFLFYLKVGINHILDINAYDHLLFLSSITLPYTFKRYYSLFWIVTFSQLVTHFPCLSRPTVYTIPT